MTSPRLPACFGILFTFALIANSLAPASQLTDGSVVKRVLDSRNAGPNLLKPDAWKPCESGFLLQGTNFVCDNGTDASARRGVVQQVALNQTTPVPIIASAWSQAENVSGGTDANYSLYVDLIYTDGTPLWGQIATFGTGTHAAQRKQVTIFPEKPVKSLSFYLLLRGHSGKAVFHDAELRLVQAPAGMVMFDGVAVAHTTQPEPGFQIRDVGAASDFVAITRQALDIRMDCRQTKRAGTTISDVQLESLGSRDRAITLTYSIPVQGTNWAWLDLLGKTQKNSSTREFVSGNRFSAGMGRLSRFPFAAVTDGKQGQAIGIDMTQPAFFRVGFNAETHELFLSYDIGFAPENPKAHLRFCTFTFDPQWEFRSALARYYEIFPEQFQCRTPQQGLWMPFAQISKVPHWEDFGFKFKEGDNETQWDDAHDIVTFRYTEPMTWWMSMSTNLPRTIPAALTEAKRLAEEQKDSSARAFATSSFHDETGRPPAQLLDTPWCNGAVWSMNSMPGITGEFTDFKQKWNPQLREKLYGPSRKGDLDGEYIDSSEGYVTDVLDFRRDHFAAADTALTFDSESHCPAIFRGLIAMEYVRGIEHDIHGMGKLMMANSTPNQLCWLAPLLDVMGTETDWNPAGKWQPMSTDELLYRRALCRTKPFCFLMNTAFDNLPQNRVENYMQRCLALGMFPGFFSADAATGQYFTRPELYERDRPLFKKYVPLCKLVAEAGWQPIPMAHASDERVHIERFGERYLTVFNDSAEERTVVITLKKMNPKTGQELISGKTVEWKDRKATLTLGAEGVAVLDLE